MFLRTVSELLTKEISWEQLNISLTMQINGLTAELDVQMFRCSKQDSSRLL